MRVFLRDPSPYLHLFRRNPPENSEQLDRQARPRIEPFTSRLPVLRAKPLGHWWNPVFLFFSRNLNRTRKKTFFGINLIITHTNTNNRNMCMCENYKTLGEAT